MGSVRDAHVGPSIDIWISDNADSELPVHDYQPKNAIINLHNELGTDDMKSESIIKRHRIFHVNEAMLRKGGFSRSLPSSSIGDNEAMTPRSQLRWTVSMALSSFSVNDTAIMMIVCCKSISEQYGVSTTISVTSFNLPLTDAKPQRRSWSPTSMIPSSVP